MKKFLSIISLCALLVGCSSTGGAAAGSASSSPSYKAGTYEGTGTGLFGEVVMSVTFSEDAITAIETVSSNETVKVTAPAFEIMPQRIIENQSLKVDLISSATYASSAIVTAVKDAASQATDDISALEKPLEKVAGDTIFKEADVLVLGAGGAGLSAAAAAVQEGASVIVLEKNEWAGGNTVSSGGAWNAPDVELAAQTETKTGQIETLEKFLTYNPEDYGPAADTLKTLQGQITEYLAGDTTHMFDSVEFYTMQTYIGGTRKDLDGNVLQGDFELIKTLCKNSLETRNWVKGLGAAFRTSIGEPSGALWSRALAPDSADQKNYRITYVDSFINVIESNGSEIIYDTPAVELLVEDGSVVGAAGQNADGTRIEVRAKNTIVATGGYASNVAMVEEYDNYWGEFSDNVKYTTLPSTNGDGILMAKDAGANLVGMSVAQMNKGYKTTGLHAAENGVNAIFVNTKGERFVNEYAARDVYTKAAMAQGGEYFCIMSEANRKDKNGVYDSFVFDTIEEMAAHFNMDPKVLTETITNYNTYVENGEDPEFGKNVFGDTINAPYYISDWVPVLHHTMGGIQINSEAEVLNADGNVIDGLFAAGEATGGIHGGNRLGGNAIADAVTFGRIAGRNAAAK